MLKKVSRIVVIGGGTAGWISAALLRKRFRKSGDEVVLIESSKRGTIGVGESTLPSFPGFLEEIGVDEREFVKRTKATFKMGLRFDGWRQNGQNFFHPFGVPNSRMTKWKHGWRDILSPALQGRNIMEAVSMEQTLMNHGKSPFMRLAPNPGWTEGAYAYQFQAKDVAEFLRDHCVSDGVRHIDAEVVNYELDGNFHVSKAVLEGGKTVEGDFFVDCTGMAASIVRGIYGSVWNSYEDYLPVNAAIPLPYEHELEEIPSYTVAQAASSGWIWKIPTQDRWGTGYVFSTAFIDPEDAAKELSSIIGKEADPSKMIRFRAGRLSHFWTHNAVAVGFSSGFIEPLESTAIHIAVEQVRKVCNVLTSEFDFNSPVIEAYNEDVAQTYDHIRDFVRLHYFSDRRDTEFWRHMGEKAGVPQSLSKKMRLWSAKTPSPQETFEYQGQIFGYTSWLSVLDGLGLLNLDAMKREAVHFGWMDRSMTFVLQAEDRNRWALRNSIGHKEFLGTDMNPIVLSRP